MDGINIGEREGGGGGGEGGGGGGECHYVITHEGISVVNSGNGQCRWFICNICFPGRKMNCKSQRTVAKHLNTPTHQKNAKMLLLTKEFQ